MTLREDMLNGGAKGRFYYNNQDSDNNHVYQVEDFSLIGSNVGVSIVCFPSGRPLQRYLHGRINDRRATAEEINERYDQLTETIREKYCIAPRKRMLSRIEGMLNRILRLR